MQEKRYKKKGLGDEKSHDARENATKKGLDDEKTHFRRKSGPVRTCALSFVSFEN